MEEFRLGNEEKILLDTVTDEDYKARFKNRVVVTNQRCIFFRLYETKTVNPITGNEEIESEFRMEQEIKLKNIKEAFSQIIGGDGGIEFKLMNGQTAIFPLFSVPYLVYATVRSLIVNMMNGMLLVDRLVSYINKLMK